MSPRPLLSITFAVVCAHGLGLWALQLGWPRHGLESRPTDDAQVVVMSARIQTPSPLQQATTVSAPAPSPEISPPASATKRAPLKPAKARSPEKPVTQEAVQPEAKAASRFEIQPPPGQTASAAANDAPHMATPPAAPAVTTGQSNPGQVQAAPGTSPAPVAIELPSTTAAFLSNAPPPYPALSRRLGEQGHVVVRAWIEVDGSASRAQVQASSGYARLDEQAVQTVLKQWRYKPGKRGGAAEAMWVNIPIRFALD